MLHQTLFMFWRFPKRLKFAVFEVGKKIESITDQRILRLSVLCRFGILVNIYISYLSAADDTNRQPQNESSKDEYFRHRKSAS